MSKVLYLLRHGKSDWSQPVSDYRRPLVERGRRETTAVASWLAANHRLPDRVVSSAAERARHTAQLAMQAMQLPEERLEFEEGLYMASAETLLDFVQGTSHDVYRLMLVGHNPGMEDLLLHLAGDAVPSARLLKVLPTATVACLKVGRSWRKVGPETCSLEFIQRGKKL